MRNCVILIIALFSFFTSFSQSFQPTYFVIQKNAEYIVLAPSARDIEVNGSFSRTNKNELEMAVGEVILAWDYKDNYLLCSDVEGRQLAFKDTINLKRAKLTNSNHLGFIKEKIELLDGGDIYKGSCVWIIGQNVGNNTITIQLDSDRIIDIPRDKVELLSKQIVAKIKEESKKNSFKKASD